MAVSAKTGGPNFSKGVPIEQLQDGESLLGHIGEEPVLLVHHDGEFFAVGAKCSHYGGPLEQGLVVGETVHCPGIIRVLIFARGGLESSGFKSDFGMEY